MSAALTLAGRGFDVRVFEQAEVFGEVGAGLQLAPNCTRVLIDLGLEEPLRSVAFLPDGTQMRHWKRGTVIGENDLGDAVLEKYGFPYFHIHRADLMRVLLDAASEHPGIELSTHAPVEAVEQDDERVCVTVGEERITGDVLVGADGIKSVVREALFGSESPAFTGNVAWRGLVPVERLPAALIKPKATVWWGPHKHFVHYYLRRGELVNCVCVVEKQGWEVESWSERGDLAELKNDFAGWHDEVQSLIDNIDRDALFKTALYDRPPMLQWSRGRITLLGDACHPTLPFLAQGATMAIEDAAVLASLLRQAGTVEAQLKRYEDLRMERTAAIQNGSRRNATVFHMTGVKAWARNRAAKRASGRRLDWLFRYNALDAAGAPAQRTPS